MYAHAQKEGSCCLLVTSFRNDDCVLSYSKTKLIDQDGKFISDYDDNLSLTDNEAGKRFLRFHDSVGLTNAIYGLMRSSAVRRTKLFRPFTSSDFNFMGGSPEASVFGQLLLILSQKALHRYSQHNIFL